MAAVASLLFGLAVLLVAATGFAAMFGADRLRDALVRGATGAAVAATFLSYAARVLEDAGDGMDRVFNGASVSDVYGFNNLGIAAFILGHGGLASAWAYARFGPLPFLENIERSRGRGRERVMPALEAEVRDE